MRRVFDRGIRLLLAANILVVMGLLAVVVISSVGSTPGVPAQLEPTPSPSDTIPMGLAHIPTSNSCLLCHETGIKGAPIIQHEGLPGILLTAKCRSCHVQVRAGEDDTVD